MDLSIIVAICNAILASILLLGCGYVVFMLGHSPWWFLGTLLAYVFVHQDVELVKK
jgi:hypothetical protein